MIFLSIEYNVLLNHYGMTLLKARREQHNLMFIRNVHRHVVDSSYLFERFPLAAPTRHLRNMILFYVPFAHVNTVRNSPFCRIPKLCNSFLDSNREVNVWTHVSLSFKTHVITYARK